MKYESALWLNEINVKCELYDFYVYVWNEWDNDAMEYISYDMQWHLWNELYAYVMLCYVQCKRKVNVCQYMMKCLYEMLCKC